MPRWKRSKLAWLQVLLTLLQLLESLDKIALAIGGLGILALMAECVVEFLTAPIGLKNTPWPGWTLLPVAILMVSGIAFFIINDITGRVKERIERIERSS
jgi:hypothetical protein